MSFCVFCRKLGYGGEKEKELPSTIEVVSVQAVGGVIAGASSAIATTPMDTVKTRLQVTPFYLQNLFLLLPCMLDNSLIVGLSSQVMVNEGDGNPTMKQTVKKLLKEEGWRGFYKGLGPRFFSMSLWGTSMITTYEFLSTLLTYLPTFLLYISCDEIAKSNETFWLVNWQNVCR